MVALTSIAAHRRESCQPQEQCQHRKDADVAV